MSTTTNGLDGRAGEQDGDESVRSRFRRRGPFWRPGMSVLIEPWVALAETNTGHLARPCGRSAEQARATLADWQARQRLGLLIDTHRTIVAAAAVNPHGDVIESWTVDGDPPDPWGTSRWTPLRRLVADQGCHRCASVRWAGCWVAADLAGCADCLPALETADPRPCWPYEPPQTPPVISVPARARTSRARAKTPMRPQDM